MHKFLRKLFNRNPKKGEVFSFVKGSDHFSSSAIVEAYDYANDEVYYRTQYEEFKFENHFKMKYKGFKNRYRYKVK